MVESDHSSPFVLNCAGLVDGRHLMPQPQLVRGVILGDPRGRRTSPVLEVGDLFNEVLSSGFAQDRPSPPLLSGSGRRHARMSGPPAPCRTQNDNYGCRTE